jgi:hypothetical protein
MRSQLAAILLVASVPLILFSCAGKKTIHGERAQDRLFPNGTYKHEVKLLLPAREGMPEEKSFNFNGLVRLEDAKIQVVVFSFFGTTAFKIIEDLKTGEVKSEVYVGVLRKFEPRIQDYYKILREVLLAGSVAPSEGSRLKWVRTDDRGLPLEVETVGLEKNAVFKLSRFDEHRIPAEFLIEHPHFKVTVKVASYEL